MVDIAAKGAEGKGEGYEKWAALHNLKRMAATMNTYEEFDLASPEELEAARDGLKAQETKRARKACREQHESDSIVVQATAWCLKARDISKLLAPKALQGEIGQLMKEKNAFYNEYQEEKENVRELQ